MIQRESKCRGRIVANVGGLMQNNKNMQQKLRKKNEKFIDN